MVLNDRVDDLTLLTENEADVLLSMYVRVPGPPVDTELEDGTTRLTIVLDDERVDEFIEAHGPDLGKTVWTRWAAAMTQAGEPMVLLDVELRDEPIAVLGLMFPIPAALGYVRQVASERSLLMTSLRSRFTLGFDVNEYVGVVDEFLRILRDVGVDGV